MTIFIRLLRFISKLFAGKREEIHLRWAIPKLSLGRVCCIIHQSKCAKTPWRTLIKHHHLSSPTCRVHKISIFKLLFATITTLLLDLFSFLLYYATRICLSHTSTSSSANPERLCPPAGVHHSSSFVIAYCAPREMCQVSFPILLCLVFIKLHIPFRWKLSIAV